jgi:hypothetical protein
MRLLTLPLLLASALALSACSSTGLSEGASDLGSSISGGFSRSNDTYGTQRRMDVYGGVTAPVLPSIGTPGMGK